MADQEWIDYCQALIKHKKAAGIGIGMAVIIGIIVCCLLLGSVGAGLYFAGYFTRKKQDE